MKVGVVFFAVALVVLGAGSTFAQVGRSPVTFDQWVEALDKIAHERERVDMLEARLRILELQVERLQKGQSRY